MRRKRLKILGCSLGVLLCVYVFSYVPISAKGHYEPLAYGLRQGPSGESILAPKAAFGYRWHPFDFADEEGETRLGTILYLPLIALDRKIWHTEKRMESGRYRVKNYFDEETMTYRDIEPD